MLALLLIPLLASDPTTTLVRCSVNDDPHGRVYELQRSGEGERAKWMMTMRSREAGASPVVLPLPDAKPMIGERRLELEYRTLNGGRNVKWRVDAAGASSIDVYTNFELEVNIDADLDPRVELMNTEGAIDNLSCAIEPVR